MVQGGWPGLKKGLERLKDKLEEPVKLSETEKAKFTFLFTEIKDILDDTLEIVLEMPRDEAYRYRNLFIQHLQQVDVEFMGGIKPVNQGTALSAELKGPPKPKIYPDLKNILDNVPEPKRKRALEVLACLKEYRRLSDEGENARGLLCEDCSPEKMLQCLNTEDPAVEDEMDRDLREKARKPAS